MACPSARASRQSALPLVARHGQPQDDGVAGPMGATPHLARCPYVRQVLAALRAPLGRSRLMRLDSGAEATRTSTPTTTGRSACACTSRSSPPPGVRFLCGDAEAHMGPGEVWIFDTWRAHNVLNPPGVERIHLVVDTVGSGAFWALARDPSATPRRGRLRSRGRSATDAGNGQLSGRDESLRVQHDLVGLASRMRLRRCGSQVIAAIDAQSAPGSARLARDLGRRMAMRREGWARYAALIRKLREIGDPAPGHGQARQRTGPGAPHPDSR